METDARAAVGTHISGKSMARVTLERIQGARTMRKYSSQSAAEVGQFCRPLCMRRRAAIALPLFSYSLHTPVYRQLRGPCAEVYSITIVPAAVTALLVLHVQSQSSS